MNSALALLTFVLAADLSIQLERINIRGNLSIHSNSTLKFALLLQT